MRHLGFEYLENPVYARSLASIADVLLARHAYLPSVGKKRLRDEPKQPLRMRLPDHSLGFARIFVGETLQKWTILALWLNMMPLLIDHFNSVYFSVTFSALVQC